jgi:hypothetical protein
MSCKSTESQVKFWRNISPPSWRFKRKTSKKPSWSRQQACSAEEGAIFSTKTLVDFCRTTWHYIPEDRNLHNHQCENLKLYTSCSLPPPQASSFLNFLQGNLIFKAFLRFVFLLSQYVTINFYSNLSFRVGHLFHLLWFSFCTSQKINLCCFQSTFLFKDVTVIVDKIILFQSIS